MRMDFSTYISLYGGKRHRKTNKEAENNYRKPENQSQHNDFPICGKNKRRKRRTKGPLLSCPPSSRANGTFPKYQKIFYTLSFWFLAIIPFLCICINPKINILWASSRTDTYDSTGPSSGCYATRPTSPCWKGCSQCSSRTRRKSWKYWKARFYLRCRFVMELDIKGCSINWITYNTLIIR